MDATDVPRLRLVNQAISVPETEGPAGLARRMGMLQAQDYYAALWAVGLRLPHATEQEVEKALQERRLVRTWPARGTLHFVPAEDVYWMLELMAGRVISGAAGRYRQLGLSGEDFSRSRKALTQALRGENQLTRPQAYQALEAAHISTAGQRGIHILGRLAMDGLLCFGGRQGKQQTFVLLDEWVPHARSLPREQALAELVRRYFTSHGPATLKDFSWWSGLTLAEARRGLELAADALRRDVIDGQDYWSTSAQPSAAKSDAGAVLLPAFDEYLVGYKDRRAVLEAEFARHTNDGGGMLSPVIVTGGLVTGTWKRILKKERLELSSAWFKQPSPAQWEAFNAAAERYAKFVGLPAQPLPPEGL